MHERINDQLLVGVCFGVCSTALLVTPYDYKYLVHIGLPLWNTKINVYTDFLYSYLLT